jgi:hypothetical protein
VRTALWILPTWLWLALPSVAKTVPADEDDGRTVVQVARPEPPACDDLAWRRAGRLPPPLGAPQVVRGDHLITGFALESVSPTARQEGRGGITGPGTWSAFDGCSDDPRGRGIAPGTQWHDPDSGLSIEVTAVRPAGRSGRGWPGVRCGLRLSDPGEPSRYLNIPVDQVPAFNQPTGVVRDGDRVYLLLQFNGYAREIKGKGNLILAGDLCRHRVVWRSSNLVSNAPVLLRGEYLITGYGFSKEKDWLYVLDRRTGRTVQKLALPKSVDALRASEDQLFARLYDGYAVLPFR